MTTAADVADQFLGASLNDVKFLMMEIARLQAEMDGLRRRIVYLEKSK